MTRAERLAEAKTRTKKKIAAQRKQLAKVEAAQRAEELKARTKRRYQVGTLADEAGLFGFDDTTLAGLFHLLAPLIQMPNPVAVLESFLCDPEGLVLAGVEMSPEETACGA